MLFLHHCLSGSYTIKKDCYQVTFASLQDQ
nr:MAG TPA: hypothetical protein [Caudoviricetes sp.]